MTRALELEVLAPGGNNGCCLANLMDEIHTLLLFNVATKNDEHCTIYASIYLLRMVIFHSYVK